MSLWILLVLTLATNSALALISEVQVPGNTSCACPGEVLTFVCTAVGPGQTIWRGTAFNCTGENNEIILRHSEFASPTGTSGTCNSGDIVGQSLGVENANCYVSQLNITIQSQFNNKTVECVYSSNTENIIGQSQLRVVSASNLYLPPNKVSLVSINQRQVTFNWTSVSSSCPSIDYVITSDCGVCPSNTNSTTVTCSDLQLPTQSDDSVCSFNVSSRVCGIVGNHTTAILTATVPGVPQVIIIPLYSNESQSLKRLTLNITINNTEVITNDVSGPITEYNVTYLEQFNVIQSSLVAYESESCKDDVCNFIFDSSVPSVCPSSTDINVTVSATNRIGQGPSSEIFTIGCTNDFVQLDFNTSNSVFFCKFLTEDSDPEKSCSIEYGLCDQQTTMTVQGHSTSENQNSVELDLQELRDGTYCFLVTAQSEMTVIQVEGNFTITESGVNVLAISLGVVLGIVSQLLLLVILCVVVVFVIKLRSREGRAKQISIRESDPYKKLKLKPITGRNLKTYKIDKSCAILEMVTQLPGVQRWRGNAFYQLTEEEEDITDDKEIILQKKNTKEYFSPGVDTKTLHKLGLCGERITKGRYGDEYIIFVQSKGSGARHLEAGTSLLYDHDEKEIINSDNIPLLPYQQIPSDYFIMKEIDNDGTTLKQLCVQYNLLLNKNKTRNNVYLEFSPSEHDLGSEEIRDILLMAKDGKLYTGPVPLLNRPGAGSDVDQKWRYFALKKFDENLVLKQNQQVLFENPEYINVMFYVRKVEEENIRMSVFVKNNFGSFERGRAFYEFIQKEDLLFWTKAIRMEKGNIKDPKPKDLYEATAEVFYDIPRIPGIGIQPPKLAHVRVLLQSTSLGSRCLKKGTYLLYSCKDLKYEDRETNKADGDTANIEPIYVNTEIPN